MQNLTQQLKGSAEQAFQSLSEGWRELKARASGALTRFRAGERREEDDDSLPSVESWAYLAADVVEDDDAIAVRLEVPGMRREDFTVELWGNTLRVRGEKRIDRTAKHDGYQLIECAYGAFERNVPLPVPVQIDKTEATYRDGVLRIRLPKAEGARPARISVGVS